MSQAAPTQSPRPNMGGGVLPNRPGIAQPGRPGIMGPNQGAARMQPNANSPAGHALKPPSQQPKPLKAVHDIRQHSMTDEDARAELSEYYVVRFQKAREGPRYNDEGQLLRSTWDQVVRHEVQDMSKAEVVRQIYNLHLELPLGDKRKLLNTSQQSQLDVIQKELQDREQDQRYKTTLVQLDHQLRRKPHSASSHPRSSTRYHNVWVAPLWSTKPHRRASVSGHRRHTKETVSITAYYKRSLKDEFDALLVWKERKEKEKSAQSAQSTPPKLQVPGIPRPDNSGNEPRKKGQRGLSRSSSSSSSSRSSNSNSDSESSYSSAPKGGSKVKLLPRRASVTRTGHPAVQAGPGIVPPPPGTPRVASYAPLAPAQLPSHVPVTGSDMPALTQRDIEDIKHDAYQLGLRDSRRSIEHAQHAHEGSMPRHNHPIRSSSRSSSDGVYATRHPVSYRRAPVRVVHGYPAGRQYLDDEDIGRFNRFHVDDERYSHRDYEPHYGSRATRGYTHIYPRPAPSWGSVYDDDGSEWDEQVYRHPPSYRQPRGPMRPYRD